MTASNKTTTQAVSPPFGIAPLQFIRWWIIPRTTDRDEKFRETIIRSSSLVLITATAIAMLFVLIAFDGNVKLLTDRVATMVIFISLLSLSAYLAHRKYITVAGWALLMMPSVAFINFSLSMGLWINLTIFFLLLVSLYGQLVLPREHIKYLVFLSFAMLTFIQFFPAPILGISSSPSVAIESLVTRPTATALTIIFLVVINTLLYVLRREFDSRQDELRSFVTELDSRVQERTRELDIARKQAEDANTIKSKFLANMSHELRTPLNAILNFTAFVADGVMGDVNEEQEDALRQSISSGKHLLSLINDILDVTKIEAGLMDLFIQPVDLNEIINGVVGIGKGLSKDKPIDLITDIQEKLPVTYGDKRRMRQVFLNIVSNAFKFTPKGSITINAHATDTHLHVHVKDTGIGISPEHQKLVFESFKQVQNDTLDTVGTGLGMPISKYFVESHRGRMWFETVVGEGTTFFVELPILTEAQANALDIPSL
ncbi:MAG: ATP-binding protein [Phototrophicales bacterium]|nr:ATP-binding protein [Phototrophicales bacterium]